jgi:hypothetical protein
MRNENGTVMKIGVIKYRKYEERVLLDKHFIIDDLFKIILTDKDFMWFNIIDEKENVLLSTWYPDTEKGAKYIRVATKVKREVEILGTTYNAYKTPSYTYRTKTTWKVGSYSFRLKKDAQGYVDQTNRRARWAIEKYME